MKKTDLVPLATAALLLSLILPLQSRPGSSPAAGAADSARTAATEKQRTTMGRLKTVATALEAYSVDHNQYPEGATIGEAMKRLAPDYLAPNSTASLSRDAWGRDFHYLAWREDAKAAGADHYMLVSAGQDGAFDHDNLRDYREVKDTALFSADIAIGDGQFTQQPVGRQQ